MSASSLDRLRNEYRDKLDWALAVLATEIPISTRDRFFPDSERAGSFYHMGHMYNSGDKHDAYYMVTSALNFFYGDKERLEQIEKDGISFSKVRRDKHRGKIFLISLVIILCFFLLMCFGPIALPLLTPVVTSPLFPLLMFVLVLVACYANPITIYSSVDHPDHADAWSVLAVCRAEAKQYHEDLKEGYRNMFITDWLPKVLLNIEPTALIFKGCLDRSKDPYGHISQEALKKEEHDLVKVFNRNVTPLLEGDLSITDSWHSYRNRTALSGETRLIIRYEEVVRAMKNRFLNT